MTKWILGTLATVVGLALAAMIGISLFGATRLREPLERYASSQTQRAVRIAGPLEIHLLSRYPTLTAQGITLANPAWVPRGQFARIGTLSVSFEWPGLTRPFAIHQLTLHDATVHVYRDQAGLANWQWRDPRQAPGLARGTPLIRALDASNLHLELTDIRRRLRFSGPVSIRDRRDGKEGLRILGVGQLNGRPAVFDLDGDPLRTVSRKAPYRFAFAIRSSGSKLLGEGHLPSPLDVRYFVTTFRARGADLKDLYFLTGLRLIDTGKFSLSGQLTRADRRFQYDDLHIESGQSDLSGDLSIDATSPPSKIDAHLKSRSLHLSDLGAQAASRTAVTRSSTVLTQTPISLFGVSNRAMRIRYEAKEIVARRVSLQSVTLDLRAKGDVLNASLRSAQVLQGNLQGNLIFDVSKPIPLAKLNLIASNLHPEAFQLKRSGPADLARPPPVSGIVAARISLLGSGRSMHELGSSATGSINIALSRGAIRRSFAEIAGVNLQGLGLMLSHDMSQTEARCGIASFKAQDGIFEAQTLLLDTEPVLIEGHGTVDLNTESIDMKIQGHPKHVRLRLRAPLTIQGSLRHPTVGMAARGSLGQTSAAVAIGVLIAPLAAALALVDPGLTKDADCAQLISAATTP